MAYIVLFLVGRHYQITMGYNNPMQDMINMPVNRGAYKNAKNLDE
jgi:hypothetical protein